MDEQKTRSFAQASLAASVMTAVATSICCIGPIVAAFLGLTSFAALVRYEPLRPLFAVITVAFLGGAFYLAYREPPAEACEPGSICATQGATRVRNLNRIVLWVATAVVVAILTFPTWSNWVLG